MKPNRLYLAVVMALAEMQAGYSIKAFHVFHDFRHGLEVRT